VDTVLVHPPVELVSELLLVRLRVRFAFSNAGIVSTTKRRLSTEESDPLRTQFASWNAGIVSTKRRLGMEEEFFCMRTTGDGGGDGEGAQEAERAGGGL
jgi:hypothetical protein